MTSTSEQPLMVARTADTGEANPYLLGVYAPVGTEIDAADLQVVGEIPKDLNGVYLRNGPNPRFAPEGRYHWFDGDGMIHAVHLENGKARYRNRWIRTKAFEAESAAGKQEADGCISDGAATHQAQTQHRKRHRQCGEREPVRLRIVENAGHGTPLAG